eukprot:gb/GECG01000453.1/.p1 GENE.gb/GECG01000453.1/~~gb/GECG01000453.1/.p1  ORF type:complete len:126 (+),score=6.38 gb/GECG01000453.1/:1-378(+)
MCLGYDEAYRKCSSVVVASGMKLFPEVGERPCTTAVKCPQSTTNVPFHQTSLSPMGLTIGVARESLAVLAPSIIGTLTATQWPVGSTATSSTTGHYNGVTPGDSLMESQSIPGLRIVHPWGHCAL